MAAADGLDDDAVRLLLRSTRCVALVGASNRPDRPSHAVLGFLLDRKLDVVPVNPVLAGTRIRGRLVAGSLADAAPLDMVDVFRRESEIPGVVEEAIRLGARSVWMQLGLVHGPAADRARRAGLVVAMDRCPAIEWPRLGLA